MVHPAGSLNGELPSVDGHRSMGVEAREGIVAACAIRSEPFLAVTVVTVQHQRLDRFQRQRNGEIAAVGFTSFTEGAPGVRAMR